MRTNEELKKLASLERMAIADVDAFIDHQRGALAGVQLQRFTNLVTHEYNLRDYIGRTDIQLVHFFTARRHLWTITGGLIGKVASTTRFLLLESAVFINNRRGSTKKRADIFEIAGVLRTKWPPKESWTSDMVKAALETHHELFKVDDKIDAMFECRVSTVGGVILPASLFSPHNASRLDGILNKNDDDHYSSSTNSESVASYGGGDRGDHGSVAKHGGERSPYSSSGAAAAAPSKPTTDNYRGDTIEGVGRVDHVGYDFAIAYIDETTRIFCHINTFEEKFQKPLTDHVGVDEELNIEAYRLRRGKYVGRFAANRVSTKKSPPEHERRDRDRSDAMDRHRGTSDNRAAPFVHHRRSNSPPIAGSTKPKRSATSAFNGAEASSYSAADQGAVRSVHDRDEPMIKKKKEEKIRLVDVGVCTDLKQENARLRGEIDKLQQRLREAIELEQLLLRVLRRSPNSRFSME